MDKMIGSYPQVFNIGHRAIADLFLDPVLVQEKVDGSQFSFCRVVDHEVWDLHFRSKGATVLAEAPGMFKLAVENVRAIVMKDVGLLRPNHIYRGEFLAKPKHNALAYDRVPRLNIIIYDIQDGTGEFLPWGAVVAEADRLGFETVPFIHEGLVESLDQFKSYLEATSVLGGQKVEGVVVKNYLRFGLDKKPLFGKFVSEAYKEVHSKEWKNQNPGSRDIIETMTARFRSVPRWQKAVQHLRDAGALEMSPRDIGKLIAEIQADVEKECKEEIKDILWSWAWKGKLQRKVSAGLAEWWKEELLKGAFTYKDMDKVDELLTSPGYEEVPTKGPPGVNFEDEARADEGS